MHHNLPLTLTLREMKALCGFPYTALPSHPSAILGDSPLFHSPTLTLILPTLWARRALGEPGLFSPIPHTLVTLRPLWPILLAASATEAREDYTSETTSVGDHLPARQRSSTDQQKHEISVACQRKLTTMQNIAQNWEST